MDLEAQRASNQVLGHDKLALFYSMQSGLTSHTEFELIYLRAERTYSYTHSRPLLPLTFCPGSPGVAGQSCNQSIRTAQAARPQKVHQKEEKGSAAEAAPCKLFQIPLT